jgi:hypothetical protein
MSEELAPQPHWGRTMTEKEELYIAIISFQIYVIAALLALI